MRSKFQLGRVPISKILDNKAFGNLAGALQVNSYPGGSG
jgi:hypothetical protein